MLFFVIFLVFLGLMYLIWKNEEKYYFKSYLEDCPHCGHRRKIGQRCSKCVSRNRKDM